MEHRDHSAQQTGHEEPAIPAAASGPALAISHARMNDALAAGTATPFAPAIIWLTRYQDRWWIVYEHGWLCITDELATADIDQRAALINASDQEGSCPPPHS